MNVALLVFVCFMLFTFQLGICNLTNYLKTAWFIIHIEFNKVFIRELYSNPKIRKKK